MCVGTGTVEYLSWLRLSGECAWRVCHCLQGGDNTTTAKGIVLSLILSSVNIITSLFSLRKPSWHTIQITTISTACHGRKGKLNEVLFKINKSKHKLA